MHHNSLEFSVASAEIKGARDYQEDAVKVWRPGNGEEAAGDRRSVFAVLSDGMGGHVSGEIASKIACEQSVRYFSTNAGAAEDRLERALFAANESLEQAIQTDSRLAGMGCTLVLAYIDSDGLRWASVGDSSLLVYRRGQLIRLNDDHSLGALLDKQAAAKVISVDEANNSPNRRTLRSALTGGRLAITDIERTPFELQPDDWVILASDGLETLSGNAIASTIGHHGNRNPTELADKLLRSVSLRKVANQDNTSVIAIRVQNQDDAKTIRATPALAPASSSDSDTMPYDRETDPRTALMRGAVVGKMAAPEPSTAGPSETTPILASEAPTPSGWGRLFAMIALVLAIGAATWFWLMGR